METKRGKGRSSSMQKEGQASCGQGVGGSERGWFVSRDLCGTAEGSSLTVPEAGKADRMPWREGRC